MSIGRYAGDYMARVGSMPGGYVGKKDFSIDGKSWEYRNPFNRDLRDDSYVNMKEYGDDGPNPNAYKYTNPLYDYSYGQVRDAAKIEGIGNVNSEEEVARIIARIQGLNNPEPKEKKDKDKDKEPTPEKPPVTAPMPSPNPEPSPEPSEEQSPTPIQPLPTTPIGSITGKLNPILNVSQANPVTVTGNKNKTNVDNSINQNTMDASDNRIFYGGSTRTFNNPYLSKAAAMVTNSTNQEGKDFMESSSNAQELLANGFMDKFMRDRLFG